MNPYRSIVSRAVAYRKALQYRRIYRRFKKFTMISEESYVDNLFLAESVKNVEGCAVECGVWRGGMSAGIAALLGPSRNYYLLDSFEGLPPAREIDGEAALRWQQDEKSPDYHDNCAAPQEFAEFAMRHAGCESFRAIKGWFADTLPSFDSPEPIALLRLDADWYESTMTCLESSFDRIVPGGLILLDDYYTWDGCSRALHDFLSRESAPERIQCLRDVCFIRKLQKS